MDRIPAYEREPYRRELEVEVVAIEREGEKPYALLDDTILYPEGGGQPADRGRLGELPVIDVQRVGGEVRHYLDLPAKADGPSPCHTVLTLDWERRVDHMQQHTAQHLLTAVAADRWGWQTTSFHLQPEICDVELDVPEIVFDRLAALEEEVAAEIRAGRAVTARRVSSEEYARLEVRSRGLPAGHRGDVRLVEIAGLDVNTCGGTHLRSTAEIECLKLLGAESVRGGTRLCWIAGGRVRRRLARGEARLAELRAVLEASDPELAAIARLKLDRLKASERRVKSLASRLAAATADVLAARRETVIAEHFEDADAAFLQQVGRRFSASSQPGVALLTAAGEGGSFFLLAAGGGCDLDLQDAGRAVAVALGGRGGGSGRLFQGKAESLDRLTEARAALARRA